MGGCLQIEIAPWKRVALTRAIALGPALAVATSTVNNSHLYNSINEYLNVLQSFQRRPAEIEGDRAHDASRRAAGY